MLMPANGPKGPAIPKAKSLAALAHPVRPGIVQPHGAAILPTGKDPT